MKIGLLGGSFNPPHNGHLAMARAARDARNLDHVWFLVAPRPPHKSEDELGNFTTRFEMAKLAARELPFLEASDFEANLPGTSYTYRTLEMLTEKQPKDELYFIIGADTVGELATWKKPERILELTSPVVVPRSRFSPADVEKLRDILPARQLDILRESYILSEPVDISSTMIREKVRRGEKFDHLVPQPVARYILTQDLYR